MKTLFFKVVIIPGILIVLTSAMFMVKKSTPKSAPVIVPKGIAVIELFTSEGCSSCPPADEAIAKLLANKKDQVFILTYHVDYWDRLGWKDPFSSAVNTQRQGQYASIFQLNSIYTPQVVVNGSSEFVGSDEQKLEDAVEKNLSTDAVSHITLAADKSGNVVTVRYNIQLPAAGTQLFNLALVQPEATISVKRGENARRTLHHVNIVRSLKTITAIPTGTVSLDIPADLTTQPLLIIAYTQDKQSLKISGASQKEL